MNRDMSAHRVFRDSSGSGETLGNRALPVLGKTRRNKPARYVFWRNYGLVMAGFFIVRIILDLVEL